MYAKLSLKQLKICTEDLEDCEKKLKRDLAEIYEVQMELKKINYSSMEEVLRKLQKHRESLVWTLKHIEKLKLTLFYIIHLYEICETKIVLFHRKNFISRKGVRAWQTKNLR